MIRRMVLLPWVLLPLMPACDSAGGSCTLIGCAEDGLVIELTSGSGIPAGSYRITAGATAGSVGMKQCDFVLPSTGADPDPDCRVGESGVMWPGFAPTELTVIVARDGNPAHSDEHVVTYQESRPNGPDCGPVCRSGRLVITLD